MSIVQLTSSKVAFMEILFEKHAWKNPLLHSFFDDVSTHMQAFHDRTDYYSNKLNKQKATNTFTN